MSASPPPSTSPTSRKRSHDELDDLSASKSSNAASDLPTPPAAPSVHGSGHSGSRQGSPTLSVNSSVPVGSTSGNNANSTPSKPPTKKRKLTFAEKEAKRVEKETKDREKAEEKARKDEEKRVKEEEKEEAKRKRELKKAEKQKFIDAKEEEKKKKEEEKAKKDKSQLRLNSFFVKTPSSNTAPSSRRGSVASMSESDAGDVDSSAPAPQQQEPTDFEKAFPSFYLPSHATLAPINHFGHDEKAVAYMRNCIDVALQEAPDAKEPPKPFNAIELLRLIPNRGHRRIRVPRTVQDILAELEKEQEQVIDLTRLEAPKSSARAMLNAVPLKILADERDSRPAYIGTFTRPVPPESALKLTRKPFERTIPNINYDYDSEAEWEPRQDGDEDLDSEEEDIDSDEGDEEMDGFLDDDEDSAKVRGRVISGDLVPECSGLRWEDASCSTIDDKFGIANMRMRAIAESHAIPIDPYSTCYWLTPPKASNQSSTILSSSHLRPPESNNPMYPPRMPLHAIKQTDAVTNQSSADVQFVTARNLHSKPTMSNGLPMPKKTSKLLSSEMLPDFKQAVQGSNLTKAGLIEVLKKKFPKLSKDVIKDTLTTIAKREGAKEVDKKWVLLDDV